MKMTANRLIFIPIFLFFCFYVSSSKSREYTVELNKYINHKNINHVEYVITDSVDLQGTAVRFPFNSILTFNGGKICNGEVVGDSTIIRGNLNRIFSRIKISGSWKIYEISTDIFCENDTNILLNISNLSSNKQPNRILINIDCKTPIKPWDSFFEIKSNTTVVLNADIYTLPTKEKGGYAINIKGKNIIIKGNNHFLFGTIGHNGQTDCPEFLHGLNITSSAKKIRVDSLKSWMFCGDGFYNAGTDVLLNFLDARFNGRQGLSITNGSNIKVNNSTFSDTGLLRINDSKGPGAGIDIEPNRNSEVHNVIISCCTAKNNYRYMKGLPNDIEIYSCKNGNIQILNSSFNTIYIGSSSKIKILNCKTNFNVFEINSDINDIISDCSERIN